MEDWHSAYSEPWNGSDISSEYGYVTAFEDLASICSRSFGRSVSCINSGDVESECYVTLYNADVTSERLDHNDILRMLYTLNDCIWCTNLFVKEKELEGTGKRKGFCSKRQKRLYSSDDACKELHYIEIILEKLLENVSRLVGNPDTSILEKSDQGYDLILSKDTAESQEEEKISGDGKSDGSTENADLLDEKVEMAKKLLRNGSCTNEDEKESALNRAENGNLKQRLVVSSSTKGESAKLQEVTDNAIDGGGKETERMDEVDECNVTYVFPGGDNSDVFANGDAGTHFAHTPIAVGTLMEINCRVDLYKKHMELNEKITLVNRFLDIVAKDGLLVEHVKSMDESLIRRRSEMPTDLELTKGPSDGCPCGKSWNPFRVTSVDSLLFEKEKWRVEVIQKNGGDPLEHLCGIALPLQYDSFKNDTRATYYGIKRKNLLSISLQTADKSEKIFKTQFQKVFSFFMLLLSISLYFSDLVSDIILAGDHYTNGSIDYAALTLTFVFAPLIAETLSKLILKALGWDKEYGKLKWKDVFNFNDFKIVKWMANSVNYSLNAIKDYRTFAPIYAELHSHRCSKGKEECCFVGASAAEEGADSMYIHTVFSSMLAWNERFTLQTKLAESLNESAPQLLLQLTIVIRQFAAGNLTGFKSWLSIVTSILSLSWSLHLSHFNRHYHEGGKVLNNAYEWSGRIIEFIGNVFVYGSRLTSICLVTSVLGVWAIVGALAYLTVIYFVMITCSGRKEIYKTLHRYKTTIFWPLHRLFTVPYRIGIWRMDSLDHLLFYLEIVWLALSLPFLMPAGLDRSSAWIATGSVLAFEVLGIALLYIFKRFFHPYGYVCENR